MAYEYEHRIQGIIWSNEDYWCIDNDKESNELREVYRKAKAWQTLKEEILNEYPGAVNIQKYYAGSYEFAIVQKLEEIGNKMDELDGTHEFSNLLDDMNRSE
ncbi:hypothetical protein [Mammaliicoccus lentus]|uniref:hypothetical protein n=1 Tax=Mammaliicoccus lentus TaxID=42858 RepID=UPI00339467FD